jgi:hypothetical protein
MDTALKKEIQEIVELVKTVPETLQARTLELLLQDALDRAGGRPRLQVGKEEQHDDATDTAKTKKKSKERESEGLDLNTLPMRVKAFMKKNGVTIKQLEKLFHVEGKEVEPMWTLTTTKFSKAQVQTALLQALQRALTSGEFSFDREEVKTACRDRGNYNEANFKANFHNNNRYFSGLERAGLVSLTDAGMTALATLITALAGNDDAK